MVKLKKNTVSAIRKRLDRGRSEQGFTLVELLVSISILTVIMIGMIAFMWSASSYWRSGQSIANMTDNARLGLNRMTRELRQASIVETAQTNLLSYKVDFGGGQEIITYGFSAGDSGQSGYVWRSTSAVPGEQLVLVEDVDFMQFSYFGNDYKCDTNNDGITTWAELQACSTTPVSKVARVDISLTLKAGEDGSQTFVDQAWLRNRLTSS